MTLDGRRIARQFARHAATYDRHTDVQRHFAERVAQRLALAAPAARRVLELGCGTGVLTELLLERLPEAEVVAVDRAQPMLALAARRLGSLSRLELVCTDVETLAPGQGTFDAVISSSAIQWLVQPERTLGRLACALAPGGVALHATFGPATLHELFAALTAVEAERGVSSPPRRGLRLRSAQEWAELHRRAGFEGVEAESTLIERTYPSCHALLRAIKRSGASYSEAPAAPSGLLLAAMSRYDLHQRRDGGVGASYELVEIAARKRLTRS